MSDVETSGPHSEQILSLSVPTPIGRIWLAARDRTLVRVELPGSNAEMRMNVWLALHFPTATRRCGVNPVLKKAATEIEAYFTAALTEFSVPYELTGTPFQIEAWRCTARIPFGETRTYGEIAGEMDNPRAVRAVGSAQSANPIPIVVPCHRVIGANGGLTGYAGGVETKKWLLEHEAALQQRVAGTARTLHLAVSRSERRPKPVERAGLFRPPNQPRA